MESWWNIRFSIPRFWDLSPPFYFGSVGATIGNHQGSLSRHWCQPRFCGDCPSGCFETTTRRETTRSIAYLWRHQVVMPSSEPGIGGFRTSFLLMIRSVYLSVEGRGDLFQSYFLLNCMYLRDFFQLGKTVWLWLWENDVPNEEEIIYQLITTCCILCLGNTSNSGNVRS